MNKVRIPEDKDATVTLAPLVDFTDPEQRSPYEQNPERVVGFFEDAVFGPKYRSQDEWLHDVDRDEDEGV